MLLQYPSFPVSYESGIINVPTFDAHIEIYAKDKIVRINYDTPYVKGLPVTMTIRECLEKDGFQERLIRKTYEDPFTLQFLEFHRCAVGGESPKTSAVDAREDLDFIKMIMRAGFPTKV